MHGRAAMLLDDTGIVMTFDNMTSKNELLILTMFLPEDDKTDAKLRNFRYILLWTSHSPITSNQNKAAKETIAHAKSDPQLCAKYVTT